MKILDFSIKKKEGQKFALNSGDTNKIHLDLKEGINSHFGQNIIHGCFLITKFLKLLDNKKFNSLQFEFNNAFFYDEIIKVYKIKNSSFKEYHLFQDNQLKGIAIFNLQNKNYDQEEFKKKIYKKNFLVKNNINEFNSCLNLLSKYVGIYYPGKNSLISKIFIKKENNFNLRKNKVCIVSTKPDARFPMINNKLVSKNYRIFFHTLFRPTLNIKNKINLNKKLTKLIRGLNKNILIIGASSGIGKDFLNIVKNNNKIKIIATFNNNSINLKKKNILKIKIDVNKDIKKLKKIINDYSPISIYYFATPKIDFLDNKIKKKLYEKFYIEIPLKIINFSKKNQNYFFYPSTKFIGEKKNDYVNTKIKAEKKLSNLKSNIIIVRLPEINTRQNLSLIKRNLPNFFDILIKDQKLLKKVFLN